MQRNFTWSKISTLNESKYTKSSPQFVFSRPIDWKIKMTAQPLIGRDIFVHLSRRHKHPLLGYISVRQILPFHIYEFSETACTQNLRIFLANHYQHMFQYETERQVLKILYQVSISKPIIIDM